jgi:hypothetical protein
MLGDGILRNAVELAKELPDEPVVRTLGDHFDAVACRKNQRFRDFSASNQRREGRAKRIAIESETLADLDWRRLVAEPD